MQGTPPICRCLVITGMQKYTEIDKDAPFSVAFDRVSGICGLAYYGLCIKASGIHGLAYCGSWVKQAISDTMCAMGSMHCGLWQSSGGLLPMKQGGPTVSWGIGTIAREPTRHRSCRVRLWKLANL